MPNAKEVFFMGLMGLPTRPPTSENEVKNTSFLLKNLGFFSGFYEGANCSKAILHQKY